jgi:hypothetical protein
LTACIKFLGPQVNFRRRDKALDLKEVLRVEQKNRIRNKSPRKSRSPFKNMSPRKSPSCRAVSPRFKSPFKNMSPRKTPSISPRFESPFKNISRDSLTSSVRILEFESPAKRQPKIIRDSFDFDFEEDISPKNPVTPEPALPPGSPSLAYVDLSSNNPALQIKLPEKEFKKNDSKPKRKPFQDISNQQTKKKAKISPKSPR